MANDRRDDFDDRGYDRDRGERAAGRGQGYASPEYEQDAMRRSNEFHQNAYADFNRGDYVRGGYGQRSDRELAPRRSYRGRGPKGYQRSDDRIREDVCERLERDHDVDASDIEVAVSEGRVTLSGNVDDRWSKRRAEDIVDSVGGVKDIENRLRVGRNRGTDRENLSSDSASFSRSAAGSTTDRE